MMVRSRNSLRAIKLHARCLSSVVSGAHATRSPLTAYNDRVQEASLKRDADQELAVTALQRLFEELTPTFGSSAPAPAAAKPRRGGLFSMFLGTGDRAALPIVRSAGGTRGLYLHGGTGSGKTMLMDLFYDCVPQTAGKRRIHFHSFMLDVHARLHALRAAGERGDPLRVVARDLMAQHTLLCFDEMQVTDVGDAMILKRLFQALFDNGLVMVATSNRSPRELYLNGLQRELFLPFIDLIESRCLVHRISTENDYRLLATPLQADHTWICPASAAAAAAQQPDPPAHSHALRHSQSGSVLHQHKSTTHASTHASVPRAVHAAFEDAWARVVDGAVVQSSQLETQGRHVAVPRACLTRRAARWTFAELCEKPLFAADYLSVARSFSTVFIEGVPLLTLNNRNEVRRFITLVDILYDHNVKLVVEAAASPIALFSPVWQAAAADGSSHKEQVSLPKGGRIESGAAAGTSQPDEVFAWDRTVSRLLEMQSKEYLQKTWTQLAAAGYVDEKERNAAS